MCNDLISTVAHDHHDVMGLGGCCRGDDVFEQRAPGNPVQNLG
jgi:hypothetical protein